MIPLNGYVYAITRCPSENYGSMGRTQDDFAKEVHQQLERNSRKFQSLGLMHDSDKKKSLFNLDKSAKSTYEIGAEEDYKRADFYNKFGTSRLQQFDEDELDNARQRTSSAEPFFIVVKAASPKGLFSAYKEIAYSSEVSSKVTELIQEIEGLRQ